MHFSFRSLLKHFAVALVASALPVSSVIAETAVKKLDPAPETPALVQDLVKGGLKIEAAFDAGSKLTGWVLSSGPNKSIAVYGTADNERFLVGNLVTKTGVNLTKEHLDLFGPKVDLEKAWPQVEKSAYVVEGASTKDAKRILYIFKDANCGYCHQIWNNLQPYLAAGLQVRWIPVAFLAANSENLAAAMMTSKDPEKVIKQIHSEWGKPSSFEKTAVPSEVKNKLTTNKLLMDSLGIQGTPAIVYKDGTGKVVLVDGSPRPQVLPEITGISLPN